MSDAPDFQTIISIQTGGALTDAPDWQRVVTGPGAGPIPGALGDGWTPQAYGLGAWTFPPYVPTVANNAFTNGRLYMTLLPVGANCTVSHIAISFVAALTGPVANQNYVGIYESDNTGVNSYNLIGATAAGVCDVSFLAAATQQLIPFSSPISLTAGNQYWVTMLSHGSSNTLKVLVSNLDSNVQDSGGLFTTNYTLGVNTYLSLNVAVIPNLLATTLPNPLNPGSGLPNGQALYAQLY